MIRKTRILEYDLTRILCSGISLFNFKSLSVILALMNNCSLPGIILPSEYVKNRASGIFGAFFFRFSEVTDLGLGFGLAVTALRGRAVIFGSVRDLGPRFGFFCSDRSVALRAPSRFRITSSFFFIIGVIEIIETSDDESSSSDIFDL